MRESSHLSIVRSNVSSTPEADIYLEQVAATLEADFDALGNNARQYDREMAMNLARLVAPHVKAIRVAATNQSISTL